MKNPEKYECGSLRVKISKCGRFFTPVWEWTGKREISGISSFVRETPAQNERVGRYGFVTLCVIYNEKRNDIQHQFYFHNRDIIYLL
jgi:hypothetical protein